MLPPAAMMVLLPSLLGAAPVTLRFAWPADLQGSVKHSATTLMGEGRSELKGTMEYRFAVQSAAGGLLRMVPSDVQYAKPMDVMIVGEPGILLFDDRGAFKGIERTKGDLLDRMTDTPLPLPAEKKAEIKAQVEAFMRSEAREKWDLLTGRWTGATFTPGKPVKRASKLRLGSTLGPMMGEPLEVDAVETTTLEAGVACDAAALEKACVRLTLETAPARPLPRKPDRLGRITVKATRRVIIVVEPGTLVPRSIHTERADLMESEEPAGAKGKAGVADRSERYLQMEDVVFSYAAPGRKL